LFADSFKGWATCRLVSVKIYYILGSKRWIWAVKYEVFENFGEKEKQRSS
jgi:hypothetical protein